MVTAATVFRDYETDGVPPSGAHKVKKSSVRELLTGYETILNAFVANGGLIYTSKAAMDADLAHAEKTSAWVIGDATVANNGIYQKQGGSGSGSWTRVADLPYSFIIASDAGAGTANAIVATTSLPVTSSALVWMNVFEANTDSPVTVSFNGGSALTIKTNSGADVIAGGLVAGMILLGIVSGSTFRLVSDQASAAVQAQIEDLVADAENAADRAEEALEDFVSATNPAFAVKLNTTAVGGQTEYDLLSAVPEIDGHLYLNVYVGGSRQPKDGVAYTITSSGTKILFSEQPPVDTALYADGAATYGVAVTGATASTVSNDSTVPGANVKQALESLNANGGTFAAWDSGRTLTMKQRLKDCHILDFASPSSSSERTSEILAWADEGQTGGAKLRFGGDGTTDVVDYITEEEVEILKQGQVIEFEQTGGFGDPEPDVGVWMPRVRLRAAGGVGGWFNTTGKRVRTRRLFRGSAGDPQDATMSALINIQAEGVQLIRPSLWLDCDYTDLSPSNLGDYCDVGIFSGCRAGVQIHDPQIIGYFRRAGIYFDVTFDNELERHLDKAGNPYPMGVPRNGSDACHVYNPYIKGGRVGLAILGALPKVGQTTYTDPYYDQELGGTVSDSRGSSGFSDFLCVGGAIYGPEHHSDRRLADPTPSGGVLNQTSLEAEPDTMPACVHIDGLAGNASTSVWGHRFIGTRFATFEAFRVRLNRSARDQFVGCHIEGRNSGARMNTAGGVIDSNNYTTTSYGDISGTSLASRTTVFGSVRASFADGLAPHYYGATKPYYVVDSGRMNVPGYVLNEASALDLRSASGSAMTMRSGASTIMNVPASGIDANTTASAANVFVSGANVLFKSTSTGLMKTDVEDIDRDTRRRIIRDLRAIWYRSLASGDRPDWSWYGLIAEEVAAVDPRLVHWTTEKLVIKTRVNAKGEIEEYEEIVPLDPPIATGVMYDRISVLLLDETQEMLLTIANHETRLAALEGGAA